MSVCGKSYIPFSKISRNSPSFNPIIQKRVISSIKRNNGNVFCLVHPGFLMQKSGLIPWLFLYQDNSIGQQKSEYKKYLKNIQLRLSTNDDPLVLFVERQKTRSVFEWLVPQTKTDTVILVPTFPKDPLPILRMLDKRSPWDELYRTFKKDLGIKNIVFGGELFFSEENSLGGVDYCGCVAEAFNQAKKYLKAVVDLNFSYPNTFVPRISQK